MTGRNYAQINAVPALRAAVDRVIAVALDALATPGADDDTRRRQVMRVWMLAHGAIGLQRAGMLKMRGDEEFAAEVLQISGLAPPQETMR